MDPLDEKNRILFLDCADSTNTYLKEKILRGELSQAAVCAARQTAGRGRMGRRWESPEGGLYLSISTRIENIEISPVFSTVAAGVAIAELLKADPYNADIALKWPNDIFVAGRKLCGMLSEFVAAPGIASHVIIGIGINVNAAVLTTDSIYDAVSLMELKGRYFDVRALAQQIVTAFRREWLELATKSGAVPQMLSRWSALSETVGSSVEVLQAEERFSGKCTGVSDAFELIVENENGSRRFAVGDCRTLRQARV